MPPVSPSASAPSDADFTQIVNAVRLELEAAGNPAYVTVIVDGAGAVHASPIVFSSIGPASDHAARVAREITGAEHVMIASRHASGRRQIYNLLAPFTLKRLHVQHEVIERALADDGYAI
jgi:hypothetical protein